MTGPACTHHHPRHSIPLLGAICMAMLTALVLTSCGTGSGTGLIPASNAVALKGDLQEVAHVVKTADGNCSATKAALEKTEREFETLPSTVDSALREKLNEGISNLRANALTDCEREQEASTKSKTTEETTATTTTPSTTTSTTTTTPAATTTATTATTATTTTEETTTEATTTEETAPGENTTPAPGGGTAAPTSPATGGGTAGGLGGGQAYGLDRWEAAEVPGR